jgi:hypothetical protein
VYVPAYQAAQGEVARTRARVGAGYFAVERHHQREGEFGHSVGGVGRHAGDRYAEFLSDSVFVCSCVRERETSVREKEGDVHT